MQIEIATMEDLNSLVELWGKLSNYHKNFVDYMAPTYSWEGMVKELFEEDLKSINKRIFITKHKDIPVGFLKCELRITSEIFVPVLSGYISDVYVDKYYRGTGIAYQLMRRSLQWFKSKGIYNIKLNVNSQNIRAINFYKKFGFKEVNKTLILNIGS